MARFFFGSARNAVALTAALVLSVPGATSVLARAIPATSPYHQPRRSPFRLRKPPSPLRLKAQPVRYVRRHATADVQIGIAVSAPRAERAGDRPQTSRVRRHPPACAGRGCWPGPCRGSCHPSSSSPAGSAAEQARPRSWGRRCPVRYRRRMRRTYTRRSRCAPPSIAAAERGCSARTWVSARASFVSLGILGATRRASRPWQSG